MDTLVRELVALAVEKFSMALTEIQLKICRFHGSLAKKVPDPCSKRWLTCLSIVLLAFVVVK